MKEFIITEELVNDILGFIAERPLKESLNLFSKIQKELKEVPQEKEVPQGEENNKVTPIKKV